MKVMDQKTLVKRRESYKAKVNFENCEYKEAEALYQKAICINNETGNKSRQ